MATEERETKPTAAPGTSVGLWEVVEAGRWVRPDATFQNGEELWLACLEYFRWCADHPLERERTTTHEGQAFAYVERIPRMPSINGVVAHLGLHKRTVECWCDPKRNEYRADLAPVMEKVREIIYDTKLTAGFAGIANANLVARDLGIGDKVEQNTTVETKPENAVDPKRVANVAHPEATPDWLDAWYAAGIEPPMFSEEQIEAGIALPPLPEPAVNRKEDDGSE